MYKGNMQQFIDILNIYLKEHDKGKFKNLWSPYGETGKYSVDFYKPSNYGYRYDVYDTEDFEEQLYKIVEKHNK